jgi:hypothetical protein
MRRTIPVLLLLMAVGCRTSSPSDKAFVGIWNFTRGDGAVVKNTRPQGGGVPAALKGFEPHVLAGVDVAMGEFSVARTGLQTTVKTARSGWATFKTVPDNGLLPGVNTPVGQHALALFSDRDANWVHFPGLAAAMVGRPRGAIRTFGIAAWYLLQTGGSPPRFLHRGCNPLLRLGRQDCRLQTFKGIDRFYTEDVGNGMGGGYGFKIPSPRSEVAAARWVHLVVTADGEKDTFQVWINGEPVQYRSVKERAAPWPKRGGLQLNYETGTPSDGGVIGRWISGHATTGRTMGVASMVIIKGETIDQPRAKYLYQLGRRGIPFDGRWFSRTLR